MYIHVHNIWPIALYNTIRGIMCLLFWFLMNFLYTVDPFFWVMSWGSGGFTDFWHRLLDFRVAELHQRLKSTAECSSKKNTISSHFFFFNRWTPLKNYGLVGDSHLVGCPIVVAMGENPSRTMYIYIYILKKKKNIINILFWHVMSSIWPFEMGPSTVDSKSGTGGAGIVECPCKKCQLRSSGGEWWMEGAVNWRFSGCIQEFSNEKGSY